jgi:asparagine synthase (glutamine-hydrolysing)
MAVSRGMRYLGIGTSALELLAADAGAAIAHPLLDPTLWSAVAAAAPRVGFAGADHTLAAAAGALLPPELVARRTKASFDGLFFNRHARAFALGAWTGGDVPADFVDAAALRAHWNGASPDSHSLTLLQSAWLASARNRVREPRSSVAQ